MPRRAGRRCPQRAAAALDAATEWSLTIWGGLGIPGTGCETLEDYRTAWRLHRESILPRYVSQLPGRRPWAMYVLGEIPPPPLNVKPYAADGGVLIGTVRLFERRCYGGDAAELAYLDSLGLIDAPERAAARLRMQSDPNRDYTFSDREAAHGEASSDRGANGDAPPTLGDRPSP